MKEGKNVTPFLKTGFDEEISVVDVARSCLLPSHPPPLQSRPPHLSFPQLSQSAVNQLPSSHHQSSAVNQTWLPGFHPPPPSSMFLSYGGNSSTGVNIPPSLTSSVSNPPQIPDPSSFPAASSTAGIFPGASSSYCRHFPRCFFFHCRHFPRCSFYCRYFPRSFHCRHFPWSFHCRYFPRCFFFYCRVFYGIPLSLPLPHSSWRNSAIYGRKIAFEASYVLYSM